MSRPLQTILCVDDERDILDVARMSLELVGGYRATCCDSGQAALDVIAGGSVPDLVLLDVMMPGLNGPETLTALRRRPDLDGVPVVFMTARVQEAEIRAYLRMGVTAVIPKPFDPMKLPGEVATIWGAFNDAREAIVADGDVEARMNELRERYVASLEAHVWRLDEWCNRLVTEGLPGPARAELKGVAHRLAGTGKTYGFAEISAAARRIDDRLSEDLHMPAAELAAFCEDLVAACQTAQRARPPEPQRKTFGRKEGTAPAATTTVPATGKPCILVADDDRMVRSLFAELLAGDAHVIEAADTEEALRMMRLHRPALVLLDDIMPGGITGLKMLETLQASGEFADTPIIMITASDSDADIRRGMRAGAADYITKPFDGVRVVAGIRARLERLALKVG